MGAAIVIYEHFYQPPRENPWTETFDREPSAHPFHDWNERTRAACSHSAHFSEEVQADVSQQHLCPKLFLRVVKSQA